MQAEGGEHRRGPRQHREHDAADRDLPRPDQGLARRAFARALVGELPLGGLACLAFMALIAAGPDHAAQHVVGELDAADVQPLLHPQQAAVDQGRQSRGRHAGAGEASQQLFFGDVFAEARLGQQVVLDDIPSRERLVDQGAFVEVAQDRGMGAGQ
jgi:hypothetical protein